MAYTIRYSDFVNKGSIVIEDNTINQETSLNIPGRNTTAYGSSIAENFLHLLENFANSVQPVNPVEGQLWYDNTPGVDQLKLWDGTTWVAAGGLKKANLAPDAANSVIGDLWVDTDNQQLYLFAGSGWVLVGPEFAEGLETGTRPSTITAIDNNDYNVVFVEVKGKPVAVVSGEAFTPKAAIEGFIDGIRPGINLSSINVEGDGIPQFNGISEKSLNLFIPGQPVITAANVMRKDAENIANEPLKIKNVAGVNVGISNELKLQIDGSAGVLQHDISGSNLQIRMNNAGTTTTVITVDSTEKVGINNPSPQKELDVVGTIQTDTQLKVTSLTDSSGVSSGSIITSGGAGIAKNLYVGGHADIDGPLIVGKANLINPDTGSVNPVSAAMLPDSHNLRTIGQPDKVFSAMYATEFVGSLRGDVQGNVSGRSGLANRLSSPTVFQVAGDIAANNVEFDGQQGTVTFNTTIDPGFIGNQSGVVGTPGVPVASEATDEFLVNKSGSLYKMPRDRILGGIKAIVPIGTIMPYAGILDDPTIDSPLGDGWLICDGSTYLKSSYPTLWSRVQYSFKSKAVVDALQPNNPDEFFAVPDLRGRFPLGNDSMGRDGAANVTTDSAADLHGGSAGVDKTTIELRHLPDHEHDLVNDRNDPTGSQFYAISPTASVENLNRTHTIGVEDLTGTGTGALYSGSGSILTDGAAIGQQIDILNPFLTLNYIIYAGEQE